MTMFCRIPQWLNVVLLIINLLFLLYLMFVHRKSDNYDIGILPDSPVLVKATSTQQQVKQYDSRSSLTNKTTLSQDGHPKRKWNYDWDGRHSRWLSGSQNMVVREIFIIRHGQYYKDRGPLGTHLTELGKLQAERTGQRLRDMNMTFTRFIASTAIRAQDTAQIIHKYIPYLSIENSDLLREGLPVLPDPKIAFGLFYLNDEMIKADGERIFKAFSTHFHRADPSQTKDSTEIIVAHGNVIAYITLRLLQLDRERWIRLSVHQCSITRFYIDPEGLVTVRAVGDVGHLPRHQWTD